MVLGKEVSDNVKLRPFQGIFVKVDSQGRLEAKCHICPVEFHSLADLVRHFEVDSANDERHSRYNPLKEISISELESVLGLTIKEDNATKCIIFLDMLNSQTDDHQFNSTLASASSTGKSYNPMQVLHYFPKSEIIQISNASPTSFIHERGIQVREILDAEGHRIHIPIVTELQPLESEISILKLKKAQERSAEESARLDDLRKKRFELLSSSKILIDLKGKIIVFLDQPDDSLLRRLRSLLSHDDEYVEFQITDKSTSGSNRTKHVVMRGYPTVIYCTTYQKFDEQESTRTLLLSPESSQDKLRKSSELIVERETDRAQFSKKLAEDLGRKTLTYRVELSRARGICRFNGTNHKDEINQWLSSKQHLQPRDQRNLPRIYDLIYSITLLNCFNREVDNQDAYKVLSTVDDGRCGIELYKRVADPNELGISPEVYDIYRNAICPKYLAINPPNVQDRRGLYIPEIIEACFEFLHLTVSYEKLRRQILPALLATRLLKAEHAQGDKRNLLYTPVSP